jgi:hypothetical protein
LEAASLEGLLSPEQLRIVYDSLFWPGEKLDRDRALGYIRALRSRKVRQEKEKLLMDIQSAARAQDNARLVDLQKAKQKLDKELHELGRPEKKLTNKQTD